MKRNNNTETPLWLSEFLKMRITWLLGTDTPNIATIMRKFNNLKKIMSKPTACTICNKEATISSYSDYVITSDGDISCKKCRPVKRRV